MLHRFDPIAALSIIIAVSFGFTASANAVPAALAVPAAVAQDDDADAAPAPSETTEDDAGETDASEGDGEEGSDEETLEEMVEDHEMIPGLFTLYRNKETGALLMELSEEQIGSEFIYFVHAENGVLWAGHFRGMYRGESIFSINRYFKRIEFQAENTHFYFDPDSALSNADNANISPGILFSGEIKAVSADGTRVLIDADELFLTEALHRVRPPQTSQDLPDMFRLGKLQRNKSKIVEIGDYERNLDVVVDYVYDNPNVVQNPALEVTDPRYVTITLQHSIIAMPEEPFEPRFADQRVGYFTHQVTDLTANEVTPYRDLVNRWRLEKADPDAPLSDPVEPITFWIEDTTPERWRETIRKAALAWNEAFETAGFTNAIAVKEQGPVEEGKDGPCPAGRIDCNVMRWTSSPTPLFGGYGPSFYNPRTGEILGADIMLEWVWITNRTRNTELFGVEGLSAGAYLENDPRVEKAVRLAGLPGGPEQLAAMVREGAFDDPSPRTRRSPMAHDPLHHRPGRDCRHAEHVQAQTAFAMQALEARDAPEAEMSRLVEESMYELILHEIGHTLGLSHNMKASNWHPLEDLHDQSVTDGVLSGSVMDYMPVNIAREGVEQGGFYTVRPGPYDKWAIEFGYRPDLDEEARASLLSRSTDIGLDFGNDADDMRAPGMRGIDPRVMIDDLSSDGLGFAEQRILLARETLEALKDRLTEDGETWERVTRGFERLVIAQARAARVMSRFVGGVQVERFVANQPGSGGLDPFMPVDLESQKRAVQLLRDYVFAPDAFVLPGDLAAHLQYERRGFDFFNTTEDPKLHDVVLAIQGEAMAHVLSPVVLRRLTDSRLYGNAYSSQAFLSDLTKAVFEDDAQTSVNTYRQNLQVQYVSSLIAIVFLPLYDDVSQSAALASLREIRQMIAPRLFAFGETVDEETKAHRRHVQLLLRAVGIF